MSEKQNSLLLTNVHVLYVLEDKISKKNFRPSVRLVVWLYVRELFMWTQELSKKLADRNKIWWVSSMYEM